MAPDPHSVIPIFGFSFTGTRLLESIDSYGPSSFSLHFRELDDLVRTRDVDLLEGHGRLQALGPLSWLQSVIGLRDILPD